MPEDKKQRYTIETYIRGMRYVLVDHNEGHAIKSVHINDVTASKALFEEAIQMNRKYDDDNLYLAAINNL